MTPPNPMSEQSEHEKAALQHENEDYPDNPSGSFKAGVSWLLSKAREKAVLTYSSDAPVDMRVSIADLEHLCGEKI